MWGQGGQTRRSIIAGAGVAMSAASATAAPRKPERKTFVLAHGSWHGGWCWVRVAERLRGQGHRVYTPTFTGMGERAHLLSKAITMPIFVQDLVGVFQAEELSEVILVGHSLGGVPISGAADRMPERIRHLVYLDSVVLESGRTAFSTYPPEEVKARLAAADKANGGVAVPNPATLPPSWGLAPGSADYAWVARRITPTPLNVYTSPLELKAPVGAGLPRTYVRCVQPKNPVIDASAARVKSWPGWNWIDFPGPHDAMITQPEQITDLLLKV